MRDQYERTEPTGEPAGSPAQEHLASESGRSATVPQGETSDRIPSVSLPKGGGAIRGIGATLTPNPATGSASMAIPIPTSPGRTEFGPELSLSYDSGSGNGPFGFGWSLSLPSIVRKTVHGLPRYDDVQESDVFVLSGAEDLVPVLDAAGASVTDTETAPGFVVHRYRPRVEGLFARIERWVKDDGSGDTHWRSISSDNVLSVFGRSPLARVADPTDPRRVFRWLLEEERDDRGNATLYDYKSENGAGVDQTRASERHRGKHDDAGRAAQRYPKRIRYGNQKTALDGAGERPVMLGQDFLVNAGWMFEIVFDYGEHAADVPIPVEPTEWSLRPDSFSSYRSGFEVRTNRLCERVLMFHHFPEEPDVGADCLVKATKFTYSNDLEPEGTESPAASNTAVYTFLRSIVQCGFTRLGSGYHQETLPPFEVSYQPAQLDETVRELDPESVHNLPVGLDGKTYRWTDLHGEGLPGVLVDAGHAWFYKPNVSPIGPLHEEQVQPSNGESTALLTEPRAAKLAPLERVRTLPRVALRDDGVRLVDLAGDGSLDVVTTESTGAGFYEHDGDAGWKSFRPFRSWPTTAVGASHARLVDLTGDGRTDLLFDDRGSWVWHPSEGERGYGRGRRIGLSSHESQGPTTLFAAESESLQFADMSGDGLADLVRVRNGEICYWPNLGYGRFGTKLVMDRAPRFDRSSEFDPRRLRLGDIDGSGTNDVVYVHAEGVRIYFNESGNGWSQAVELDLAEPARDLARIQLVDLLGNGTSCLVWSSSGPADAERPLRYVNLMAAGKPHLLSHFANNQGAETRLRYAPSTRFYLEDKYAGRPWISRLSFPVQVVERVETHDRITRNRFVSRYAYHHGYFDEVEREFRGFGMVEQWDTEDLAQLRDGQLPIADGSEPTTVVPPVHTKTWFHTGIHLGRGHVSDYFAGKGEDEAGEYYREPFLAHEEASELLLPDTPLPPGLSVAEEREACRALRNKMLRQEVFAADGSPRAEHPYSVTEQNFEVRKIQVKGSQRHGVFFVHERETVQSHYERNPTDPRVEHTLTIEVDEFGNVRKEAVIAYGRRASVRELDGAGDVQEMPNPGLAQLSAPDQVQQLRARIRYTENRFTDGHTESSVSPGHHRTPVGSEARVYELTGYHDGTDTRLAVSDLIAIVDGQPVPVFDEELAPGSEATHQTRQRRLVEHSRTLYRPDDLGASVGDTNTLLPLGEAGVLALRGERVRLAFTPDLLANLYEREGTPLLPDPAAALGAGAQNHGGYVSSPELAAMGGLPEEGALGHWWAPEGREFLSPDTTDEAGAELVFAREHFFLARRFRDAFHTTERSTETSIVFDSYDLLVLESRDALGNRTTAGERRLDGTLDPTQPGLDYRMLKPKRVMDANRNRSAVAFDALGLVIATATMGKPEESVGDSLEGLAVEISQAALESFLQDPLTNGQALLGRASSRILYDQHAYRRSAGTPEPQPVLVATLTREVHDADLALGESSRVQQAFAYSDGFEREIQRKLRAEPGSIDSASPALESRWVGSGWTVYNNKGKPVRSYEPFFSASHHFESNHEVGVSTVQFYDPVGRVLVTLHPDHTYEKVVFDAWRTATYDRNDTVAPHLTETGDPRSDPDVGGFLDRHFQSQPSDWKTWYQARVGGLIGADEALAANKAEAHADTPTVAHLDVLARPFLTLAHNGYEPDGTPVIFASRIALDIQGQARQVRDAVVTAGDPLGRVVQEREYDLLGTVVRETSMDAGRRWMLRNVRGDLMRSWDTRELDRETRFDALGRPVGILVHEAGAEPDHWRWTQVRMYGEGHPEAEARNLNGALYRQLDQAGSASTEVRDFKGNELTRTRRLARWTEGVVDWSLVADTLPRSGTEIVDLNELEAVSVPALEPETYTREASYDALNRLTQELMGATEGAQPSVIRRRFNAAGQLDRVEANLRGEASSGSPVWHEFVSAVDYDAKGRRRRVLYGNGVETHYEYDPTTQRLATLETRRDPVVFPGDCPTPAPDGWPGCRLQNLRYTYDPVGNAIRIRDDAQQAVFFRNAWVDPSCEYTYDAQYRLIAATGREHLGQVGGASAPHSSDDAPRVGLASSANDGLAMGNYHESYDYDAAGNLLELVHRRQADSAPLWIRRNEFEEPSRTEDGSGGGPQKFGNRLSRSSVGGNSKSFAYDAQGNTVFMSHFAGAHPDSNMDWGPR